MMFMQATSTAPSPRPRGSSATTPGHVVSVRLERAWEVVANRSTLWLDPDDDDNHNDEDDDDDDDDNVCLADGDVDHLWFSNGG